MHLVFVAMRIYPYWAIPTVIVMLELGIFFRRKDRPIQYLIWLGIVLLVVAFFLWFFYRGDRDSDRWVRSFMSSLQN